MAKFKVGQMVKVVAHYGDCCMHTPIGTVGIVSEIMDPEEFEDHYGYEELYALDSAPFVEDGELTIGLGPDELEPILYDGAQPSEFSYSELMDNLRTKVQEEV